MGTAWSNEDREAVHARVRAVCLLPGVEVEAANGHTGFSVRGKRFAWLLVDHHDDGLLTLCIKTPSGAQQTLVGRGSGYFVPAYLGAKGWVGVDLDPSVEADWDEVAGLVEQAWRMTAPKRLVAELAEERGGDQ